MSWEKSGSFSRVGRKKHGSKNIKKTLVSKGAGILTTLSLLSL